GRALPLLQLGGPIQHFDLVLLHQVADPGVELGGHLARALDHLSEIERGAGDGKAVVAEMAEGLEHLAGLQQRLGRDAPPVQADAAEGVALDDGGLHAELRGADRRDVAARAGADHDDVEVRCHTAVSAYRRRRIPTPRVNHQSGAGPTSRAHAPQTIIVTGSSISTLKACSHRAPVAPSTTRWSQVRVTVITVATASWSPRTTGRFSPAPTDRMQPCGSLMIEENCRTPNMPRFETEKVPP